MRPTKTPKEYLTDDRRAAHAARMAEAEAPMDVVEAVEAVMSKPGNRGLAGAAARSKLRAETESRAADERGARGAERAIEARAQARAAREAREAGELEWETYREEERATRQREQALLIARRLDASRGGEHTLRRLAQADLEDADVLAALVELYGQAVADAYVDGVDAAVAALPEPW